MADDERRAEIEAVAQAIRGSLWSTWGANRQTTDWPTDGDLRVAARAALDRVRDARGDNEVDVALDAFWQVRDETQDNVQAMRAALAAASSPQDEDHGPREIAAWLRQEHEAEHRMDTLAGVARRIEEHYGY